MAEWSKQSSSKQTGVNTAFTTSGSSQATPAFGSQTYQIRVATSGQPCWVFIGDGSPTATTTNSMVMPSNWAEYFSVTPGQKAAILGGAFTASTVTVTEVS